jgi:hypothetical protein
MKTKFILTGFFLLLLAGSLFGQDKKLKFIYLESGIDFIDCDEPYKDYIRADVETYYDDFISEGIRGLMFNEYFGVKFEYRLLKNLLGVSSGLRYNRTVSSIGKTTYWSDSPDFFYVRYWNDGTTSEYAKVREINQTSHYIGIPVELRIYPYKDRLINIYYKAGVSFNLNVGSKTGIVLQSEEMNTYERDVVQAVEGPQSYFGSFHLGLGLKVGRLPKPGFIIEASIPVGILTPDEASFVTPQAGAGFQFMIRVPLNKKEEK